MTKEKSAVVAVSGGFDPVHIGHVRLFEEAKALGATLVVILNNDNWLRKKKGSVFMPQQERKEILEAFRSVNRVYLTKHPKDPTDMSVCEALHAVRPDIFANGGDRKEDNIPEVALCKELGIQMVFGIGEGGKVQSSSTLLLSYLDEGPCLCGSGEKFKNCARKNTPNHQSSMQRRVRSK